MKTFTHAEEMAKIKEVWIATQPTYEELECVATKRCGKRSRRLLVFFVRRLALPYAAIARITGAIKLEEWLTMDEDVKAALWEAFKAVLEAEKEEND